MSLFDTVLLYADVVSAVVFVVSLAVLAWRPVHIRSVTSFFVIWAGVWLFEYYFLGPYSYIHMNDEGDHFIPYYLYLVNHHLGGQFGHAVGGGHDVIAAFSPGFQLFSPEILLFQLFPIWIAILIHKLVVVSAGFVGSYLLCRRGMGCEAGLAALAGAVFTVSNEYLTFTSYTVGIGLAFFPLLVYVLVVRSTSSNYFRHALWVAALAALYLDLTHNFIPALVCLGLAALLFGKFNTRLIMGGLILIAAEAVNWGEVAYAMKVMSPYTARGGIFDEAALDLTVLGQELVRGFWRMAENRLTWAGLAALLVLWLGRDPWRWRATFALAGIPVAYFVLVLVPWRLIGLGVIENLSHHYVFLAFTVLSPPVMVRAVEIGSDWLRSFRPRFAHAPPMALLALAIAMMVWFKGYNFANLLHHGGQSQYWTIDNLREPDWRTSELSRVITLRVRDLGPEPALAYAPYGLEALDVYMMLTPKERSEYFGKALRIGDERRYGRDDPRTFIDWSRWTDGAVEELSEQLSFPLLRAANVGHILSPVPIRDNQLAAVSAPDRPPLTRHDMWTNPMAYIAKRIERLFDFNDVYVYALSDPLPRAYAAKQLIAVDDGMDGPALMRRLGRQVSTGDWPAIVRSSDAPRLGAVHDSLTVMSVRQVKNGYDVDVNAPDGGIIVLNTFYLPFWSVEADGTPIPVVQVNNIHVAANVPAGTRSVRFRYRRPTLLDHVETALSAE